MASDLDLDPNPRPLAELQDEGLLWLINRVVFHPRGFALQFHTNDEGEVTAWSMIGNGEEVFAFDAETDDLHFARSNEYLSVPN